MIPYVFISSTVEDLRHVRDAVRSTVEELGYHPVMSDYGDVGYMDNGTAETACYRSIRECQMVVLIIGKRYGSASGEDASKTVTEKEFDEAMKSGARIITLVDNDVMGFKKVFDENQSNSSVKFPNMNEPAKTFAFISRITSASTNNAIIPFTHASDIRQILRQQMANLFYALLTAQSAPTQSSLNDILSEVKTIRDALARKAAPDLKFQAAVRFLIDDQNVQFKQFVKEVMSGAPVEKWIPKIVEGEDFDKFLQAIKVEMELREWKKSDEIFKTMRVRHACSFCPMPFCLPVEGGQAPVAQYVIDDDAKLTLNQVAYDYFSNVYKKMKRQIEISE